MKINDLKLDDVTNAWFTKIDASESTKKNFRHAMAMYTDFTGLSPEELLEQAESEITLLPRKRHIETYMLGFFSKLQNSDVSEHTVRSRMTAIRSFYITNQIDVPKIKMNDPITKEENDIIPTKEDLQDCLNACDVFGKAIMLTGISSGLASNEIRSLKLSDFKNGYDPKTEITTLENILRQKTRIKFTTFLSPEASRAILEYLKERDRQISKRAGIEKNQQREKQHTSENSYLFIRRNVPDEYLSTRNEELRKMGESALENMYREISEKAQKSTKKGYNFIRSHTMRKYFNTVLLNKGCDGFFVEFWMGHKLDKTKTAYFKSITDDQRKKYMKYIPYLTIQKELDVSVSTEYQKAVERAERAEAEVERVSVGRDDFNRLKAEYEQKIKDAEKAIWHSLQMELRAADNMARTSTGISKDLYKKKAQDIRDKIKRDY